MLLSGEGDTLLSLQSLTASIGMVAFTYFLPFLFHAILSPTPLSRSRKAWAAANVLIGVFMMVRRVLTVESRLCPRLLLFTSSPPCHIASLPAHLFALLPLLSDPPPAIKLW